VQLKTFDETHGTEELRDYLGTFSELVIVAKAQLSFELFLIRWGRALLFVVGVKQSLHEVEAFGKLLWAWASFFLAISWRSSRCVSLLGRRLADLGWCFVGLSGLTLLYLLDCLLLSLIALGFGYFLLEVEAEHVRDDFFVFLGLCFSR
jgi:hypothetical protein